MNFLPGIPSSKISILFRIKAAVALFAYGWTIFINQSYLYSQSFPDYDSYSRKDVELYVDRAFRINDNQQWADYVLFGISYEKAQWEEEAVEKMKLEFLKIDSEEDDEIEADLAKSKVKQKYEDECREWESDAEDHYYFEHGKFLARTNELILTGVSEAEYEKMISGAGAAVSEIAELNIALWDSTVENLHAGLVKRFEDTLIFELNRIKDQGAVLNSKELAGFSEELSEKENEIRREFIIRDSFYLVRARNDYVSMLRADDMSAKLASDDAGASAIGEMILNKTESEVNKITDALLEETEEQFRSDLENEKLDVNSATDAWQKKIEKIIDDGLRRFGRAEEELYAQRLAWMQKRTEGREAGENIWRSNEKNLKAAAEKWIAGIREKISEGRSLWDKKFSEFDSNRENAERNLSEHIALERDRWISYGNELSDMVNGGGGALLQAKDSYRYYTDIMTANGWIREGSAKCSVVSDTDEKSLCAFYASEREKLASSISSFETILMDAESVLGAALNSEETFEGLLKDKREYAGDLPGIISEMSSENFRHNLENLMQSRDESFLLYKRDIESIINSNDYFVNQAVKLQSAPDFDYASAATAEELKKRINSLNSIFDLQKNEMQEIITKDRTVLPDETARLSEIKDEINEWFKFSVNQDLRLYEKVKSYIFSGLEGYYVRHNDNDPYLLTRAEYEWELLRRERNYLAKRLRQAEAVKHYADLAAQHDAGLEMARITAEKSEIERIRMEISGLSYQILNGDIDLDDLVKTDESVREIEISRILKESGIDLNFLSEKKDALSGEITLLVSLSEKKNSPDLFDVDDLMRRLDSLRPGEYKSPLEGIRGKLLAYRNLISENAPAEIISDRWRAISGLSGILSHELMVIQSDYDFDGIEKSISSLKDIMQKKTLPDWKIDMNTLSAEARQNAKEMTRAKDELEYAKVMYHQALLDFNVMNSSDSAAVIQAELKNTFQGIATVLNRMVKLESASGFHSETTDIMTRERTEYLYTINQGEKAEFILGRTELLLEAVNGLEAAKERSAKLESILSSADPAELKDPVLLAELFINERAGLIDGASSDIRMSSGYAVNAMNSIAEKKAALMAAKKHQMDSVEMRNSEESEILKKAISDLESDMQKQIELLIASIRGEEISRRKKLLNLLEQKDENSTIMVDVSSESEICRSSEKIFNDAVIISASDIAAAIDSYMNMAYSTGMREFAEILADLNKKISFLNDAPDTTLPGYGISLIPPALSQKDLLIAVRNWVVVNRERIIYANQIPNADDVRSQDEKWEILLWNIESVKGDSEFYQKFKSEIPDSSDDARMVKYKNDRKELLIRLDAVLSSDPSDVYFKYSILSPDDREILETYGNVEALSPVLSLENIRKKIELEVASIGMNYREIFLREAIIANQKIVRSIEDELFIKKRDIDSALKEKANLRLEKENVIGDAVRESEINGRIDELTAMIDALKPEVRDLEKRYHSAMNSIKEASNPGSTSIFYSSALSFLEGEKLGLSIQNETLMNLRVFSIEKEYSKNEETPEETIKAILGYYKTDSRGRILRNGDGFPLVSDQFVLKNSDGTESAVEEENFLAEISKNRTGPELASWADKIKIWMSDPYRSKDVSAEVRTAIGFLESSLREYLTARELIQITLDGISSISGLKSEAEERKSAAEVKLEKLAEVILFESRLGEIMRSAYDDGKDIASEILSYLESPENNKLYFIFDGYDSDLSQDGRSDLEIQNRIEEIRVLAKSLREARLESRIAEALSAYSVQQSAALAMTAGQDRAVWTGFYEFLSGYPGFDGESVLASLSGLDKTNFRENLLDWTARASKSNALYAGEISGLLSENASDGMELYNLAVNAVKALQSRIESELKIGSGIVDAGVLTERDLSFDLEPGPDGKVSSDTVAGLVLRYAERGRDSRNIFLPELSAPEVIDSVFVDDARSYLSDRMNSLLSDVVFTSIRGDLIKIMNASSDTASLKAAVAEYLNGIDDVSPSEAALLKEMIYSRELTRAMQLSDASSDYSPENYPSELRKFILLRSYAKSMERYEAFTKLRSSDIKSDREKAVLDLRGLNGDFAKYILIKDLNEYLSEHPMGEYFSDSGIKKSVSDYIDDYYNDRNSSPVLMSYASDLIYNIIENAKNNYDEGINEFVYADPDSFLPDGLTAISGYESLDYRSILDSSGGELKAVLARMETLERASRELPGAFVSDQDLILIIERAGHSDASSEIQSQLIEMLRAAADLLKTNGEQNEDSIILGLRSSAVLDFYFPAGQLRNSYELFMAKEGKRFYIIQEKLFAELERSGDDLREKAKLNRGEFLGALMDLYQGKLENSYYNLFSHEIKMEFIELKNRLFGPDANPSLIISDSESLSPQNSKLVFGSGENALTAEEINALYAEHEMYVKAFQYRSSLELVYNPLFAKAKSAVVSQMERAASKELLSQVRENSAAVMKDFIQLAVYRTQTGSTAGFIPAAPLNETNRQEYRDLLEKSVNAADPLFIKSMGQESEMLNRMLSNFFEADEELNRIKKILLDPSLINPDAAYSIGFEAAKAAALARENSNQVMSAFAGMIEDHVRFYRNSQSRLEKEKSAAADIAIFARSLGTDGENYTESSFVNYRTYLGAQADAQEAEYKLYVDNVNYQNNKSTAENPVNPSIIRVKSFEEYFNGAVLDYEEIGTGSAESILKNENWESILTSDDRDKVREVILGKDSPENFDDITVSIVTKKRVGSANADTYEKTMRDMHYANLANNYLESINHLNTDIMAVFDAAHMAADRMSASNLQELHERFRNAYDASSGEAQSTSHLIKIKNDASSVLSANENASVSGAADDFLRAKAAVNEAGSAFARSARRKFLNDSNAKEFLNTTVQKMSDAFHAAESSVNTAAERGRDIKYRQSQFASDYAGTLNEIGAEYRKFIFSVERFETAQAVRDYAETPYLYASSVSELDRSDELKKRSGDAKRQYEIASTALLRSENNLKDASYMVRIEQSMEKMKLVMDVLEDPDKKKAEAMKNPLDDAEKKNLTELLEKKYKIGDSMSSDEEAMLSDLSIRNDYEKFADLISARFEFIKHALRMIRLRKAEEIVSAEIERRRAVAEEKKQIFERSLNSVMPAQAKSEEDKESVIGARNAVYQRLVRIAESGGDFTSEFRGWYYGESAWKKDLSEMYKSKFMQDYQTAQVPDISPLQILEAAGGVLDAKGIASKDRNAVMTWLGNDNIMTEYAGFRGSYFAYLLSLGELDKSLTLSNITAAVAVPLITTGYSWMATVILFFPGYAMVQQGTLMLAQAAAQVYSAMMSSLFAAAAANQSGQNTNRILEVRSREKEYKQALFDLEYLTKMDDLTDVKKRLIAFGKNNHDSLSEKSKFDKPLYKLTEDDLNYLFEKNSAGIAEYQNSKGEDITDTIADEERNEGLDISVMRMFEEYRDSFGIKYDPSTVLDSPPGIFAGGVYSTPEGDYIAVTLPDDKGNPVIRYAKKLTESDGSTFASYNLKNILEISVNHGDRIRENKKNAYLLAGDEMNDIEFALKERSSTYDMILKSSSKSEDGGREFSGYRVSFEELNRNTAEIFERELNQRRSIQMREWDIRRMEMEDARLSWEQKMDTVMYRGQKAWTGVLADYYQKWRKWEKTFDEKTETGSDKWNIKIKKFYEGRELWKIKMNSLLAEKTVGDDLGGILSELESQLAGFESALGTDMEDINVGSAVSEMIEDVKRGMPGDAYLLSEVNNAIRKFSASLAVSEMSFENSSGGISGLSSEFFEAMQNHAQNMKILANARAFEEFKKIKASIINQLEMQDEAADISAEGSAYAAGFVKRGDMFVKSGGTLNTTAAVNKYTRYDVKSNFEKALSNSGFAELSGKDLVNYLSQQSEMEVSAFFYTQKNALQVAFEKIAGKGSAAEREKSRDAGVIGLMGVWTGRGPDQNKTSVANAAFGDQAANITGGNYLLSAMSKDGFGELGVWGKRPSGINGGFYAQLQFAGDEIAKNTAKNNATAGKTMDPFSTTLNSLNPLSMAANSYYNVEAGSRVYGYDKGKLINAQFMGIAKTALNVGGTALVVAGVASGIGIGFAFLGAAMIAFSNSMNVSTQTGESYTKMTDQSAINSAVQIGGAVAGCGIDGIAGSALLAGGGTLVSEGFEYDAQGQSHGWTVNGLHGDDVALSVAASVAASSSGAQISKGIQGSSFAAGFGRSLAASAISTGINTAVEYQKLQLYGSSRSNYAALQKTDLASGLSSYLSAAIAGFQVQYQQKKRDMPVSDPLNPVDQSNRTSKDYSIMSSLWGAFEGTREWFKSIGEKVGGLFGGDSSGDAMKDMLNDQIASGNLVSYGTDSRGRPVYYNSAHDYFVNSDGVISGSDGGAVKLADANGAGAPGAKKLDVVSGWNKERIRQEVSAQLGRDVSMAELDRMQLDGYGGFKGTIADRIAQNTYVWAGDKIILPGSVQAAQSWSFAGFITDAWNGFKQAFSESLGLSSGKGMEVSPISQIKKPLIYDASKSLLLPLKSGQIYYYNQGFSNSHVGIDLGVYKNTPVISTIDGTVVFVGKTTEPKTYGNNVIVKRDDGIFIRVAHLNTTDLEIGEPINLGDILGMSGDSGSPGSFHIHYEIVEGSSNADWQKYWQKNESRSWHRDPNSFDLR